MFIWGMWLGLGQEGCGEVSNEEWLIPKVSIFERLLCSPLSALENGEANGELVSALKHLHCQEPCDGGQLIDAT